MLNFNQKNWYFPIDFQGLPTSLDGVTRRNSNCVCSKLPVSQMPKRILDRRSTSQSSQSLLRSRIPVRFLHLQFPASRKTCGTRKTISRKSWGQGQEAGSRVDTNNVEHHQGTREIQFQVLSMWQSFHVWRIGAKSYKHFSFQQASEEVANLIWRWNIDKKRQYHTIDSLWLTPYFVR